MAGSQGALARHGVTPKTPKENERNLGTEKSDLHVLKRTNGCGSMAHR